MALFKFTKAILNGEEIDVYNNGDMSRDFTYIDDLVTSINRLIDCKPKPYENRVDDVNDSASPIAPFRIVNIGNSEPKRLEDFISALENSLGKRAIKNYLPMQAGDVPATWADTSLLTNLTDYKPDTQIEDGIQQFVNWYINYYRD